MFCWAQVNCIALCAWGNNTMQGSTPSQQAVSSTNSQQELLCCRICFEDDSPEKLDCPCLCTGTLKYAHQQCLQKWIYAKSDTKCEICRMPFKGKYLSPMRQPVRTVTTAMPIMAGGGSVVFAMSYDTPESNRLSAFLQRRTVVNKLAVMYTLCLFLLAMLFLQQSLNTNINGTPVARSSSPDMEQFGKHDLAKNASWLLLKFLSFTFIIFAVFRLSGVLREDRNSTANLAQQADTYVSVDGVTYRQPDLENRIPVSMVL